MPGAAPARGVGPEEGAFSFPHVVFLSGLGGPAGAPRHGRGRLLSCVHSSVPTSPGNTTPQPPQKSRPTWRVMLVNTAPASREGQRRFPSAGPRPACECPPPTPLHPLFTDLMPCCVLVPHGPLSLGKEPTLQPEEHGEGRCPGLPEGHPGHAPQGEDPMGRQPSPGIV